MNTYTINREVKDMLLNGFTLSEPDSTYLKNFKTFKENGRWDLAVNAEFNLRCKQLINSGIKLIHPEKMINQLAGSDPDSVFYRGTQRHIRPNNNGLEYFIANMGITRFVKYEKRSLVDWIFLRRRVKYEYTYSDIYSVDFNLPEDIQGSVSQLLEKRVFDTISIVHQTFPEKNDIYRFLLFGIVWCKSPANSRTLGADFYLGNYYI